MNSATKRQQGLHISGHALKRRIRFRPLADHLLKVVIDDIGDPLGILAAEGIPASDGISLPEGGEVVGVLAIEAPQHIFAFGRDGGGRHIAGVVNHHGAANRPSSEFDEFPCRALLLRITREHHVDHQ